MSVSRVSNSAASCRRPLQAGGEPGLQRMQQERDENGPQQRAQERLHDLEQQNAEHQGA